MWAPSWCPNGKRELLPWSFHPHKPPKSAPPLICGGTSNEWPSNLSFDIWRRGTENDDDYHYALKSRSDNSVLKADVAMDTWLCLLNFPLNAEATRKPLEVESLWRRSINDNHYGEHLVEDYFKRRHVIGNGSLGRISTGSRCSVSQKSFDQSRAFPCTTPALLTIVSYFFCRRIAISLEMRWRRG